MGPSLDDPPRATVVTDVPASMVRLLATGFLILAILLVYLLAAFWPVVNPADTNKEPFNNVTLFVVWNFKIATEIRLIWLVMIAAALGSYVHTVTSFTSYVGNRSLVRSWLWWYALRPAIGVALALIFYFVVRGGLFSNASLGKDISPFGVAALSGMVGMFSKQAADKLEEVFNNLFRTPDGQGDDTRSDKLSPVQIAIDSIDPPSVDQGSGPISLSVKGRGFSDTCEVTVNGQSRTTQFKSATALTAQIKADDLTSAGSLQVAVRSPGPPENSSSSVQLVVKAPGAP